MYREIPRTVGITEASVYGLDNAERALGSRESAALPQVYPYPAADQYEALFAAVALGALLVIIAGSLVQAWL